MLPRGSVKASAIQALMSFTDSLRALVEDGTVVWGFLAAAAIVLVLVPVVVRLAYRVGALDVLCRLGAHLGGLAGLLIDELDPLLLVLLQHWPQLGRHGIPGGLVLGAPEFGELSVLRRSLSFLAGGAPDTGWFSYAPLSERAFAPGTGVDYYIVGLAVNGAGTIIGADLFHSRAKRAIELGADRGIVVEGDNLVEQVREITNGAMADVVIVGPGTSKAIATGIAAAGKGATVVQFTATPPDDELLIKPHDLYFNETRLVPSYSCGPDETREALSLVERGVMNAKELVTHRFPLAQITEAFATAQKPESLKVIVTFAS